MNFFKDKFGRQRRPPDGGGGAASGGTALGGRGTGVGGLGTGLGGLAGPSDRQLGLDVGTNLPQALSFIMFGVIFKPSNSSWLSFKGKQDLQK
jgi:hypothetical protein